MQTPEKVQGILATIPAKPGCYLMKNAQGAIIYVGKAISLRNRVRSYFHTDAGLDAKTRRLVRDIADIEWILVGSELEAPLATKTLAAYGSDCANLHKNCCRDRLLRGLETCAELR